MKQILTIQQQIVTKVQHLEQNEATTPTGLKNAQELIIRYENEIANLKKSEENNKEILTTLGQQSQLYAK